MFPGFVESIPGLHPAGQPPAVQIASLGSVIGASLHHFSLQAILSLRYIQATRMAAL